MDKYVYVPKGTTDKVILKTLDDVWLALKEGYISVARTSTKPESHEDFEGFKVEAGKLLSLKDLPHGV